MDADIHLAGQLSVFEYVQESKHLKAASYTPNQVEDVLCTEHLSSRIEEPVSQSTGVHNVLCTEPVLQDSSVLNESVCSDAGSHNLQCTQLVYRDTGVHNVQCCTELVPFPQQTQFQYLDLHPPQNNSQESVHSYQIFAVFKNHQ